MTTLCLSDLHRDLSSDAWRPYWREPEPSKALATMLSLIAASEAEQIRPTKTTEEKS